MQSENQMKTSYYKLQYNTGIDYSAIFDITN